MRGRRLAFVLLTSLCLLAIVMFTASARREVQQTASPTTEPRVAKGVHEEHAAPSAQPSHASATNRTKSAARTAAAKAPAKPTLLYFSANKLGENYGKLAVAPLTDTSAASYSSQLRCERVHYSSGSGVCLAADRGFFTSYYAVKFDGALRGGWSIKLNGPPSRVRVSPTGRLAAITVFLTGHSYASLDFSTQTIILDVASGKVLADLDDFAITRAGVEFKSADFNFWGVTFAANENIFYATLWSKAKTYLVKGDLAARTATVIHDGVECPSLSPDNQRVAFKKRVEGRGISWRISVLDLQSGRETSLGEDRSVDDQVEWLDNDHILYALSQGQATQSSATTDIWVLPSTANGTPQVLLRGGSSPAVVRARQTLDASAVAPGSNRVSQR